MKSKEYYVTDVSYSESTLTFGCTGTDANLHFWNYQDNKLRYLKSIPTGSIQSRVWYLKRHQIWITAGRDLKIRTWEIQMDDPLNHEYKVSYQR